MVGHFKCFIIATNLLIHAGDERVYFLFPLHARQSSQKTTGIACKHKTFV